MTQRIATVVGAVAAVLLLAALVASVSLFYARPTPAQAQVGVTGMRQVTVVGQGEAKGRPDTATVQIGVETEQPTAQDALAQNTSQAQAIQAKLKELGVADKDIQTSNFSIFPTNDNNNHVTGYRVSNNVEVTIRNLDKAGTLLDQVVKVGANSVHSVTFSVDNPNALLQQARQQAMQDAKSRADQLAKAGGAAVGDVLVITENVGSSPPVPMPLAAAKTAQDSAAVPVQPGEQNFKIEVQVTFGLR